MEQNMDQDKITQMVREVLNDVLAKQAMPTIVVPTDKVPKKNLAKENIARWLGHEPRERKIPALENSSKAKTQDPVSIPDEKNLIPNARKPEKLEAMLKT